VSHVIKKIADVTDRFRQQFPYLPQAFQLVRQAAGGLIIVWLDVAILFGASSINVGVSPLKLLHPDSPGGLSYGMFSFSAFRVICCL